MSTDPAEPRLSATALLVRDRDEMEVLMVERHYQIDFAAGALVFPGGKSSDDDALAGWRMRADGVFDERQTVARIAAVREVFEESGVLLARSEAARGEGAPLVGADMVERLAAMRGAVDRGEQSFLELFVQHELVAALDTLVHFGHWITPDMMPKRFDTHFYIAKMPSGQVASADGRETTDARWLAPKAALALNEAGKATIIFPTRMNLDKLARAKSCDDAIARFSGAPVMTVLPKVSETDKGEPCLLIPAEADYCQTVELLSQLKV